MKLICFIESTQSFIPIFLRFYRGSCITMMAIISRFKCFTNRCFGIIWGLVCGGGAICNLKALENKGIIDAGAYIGDSALILQEYTRKKVYAFEAVQSNYDAMLMTIKLNEAKRIVPVHKGLGAKQSKEKIGIQGAGSSVVLPNNGVYEEIEIIPLDSFVREKKLQVGFIKVDIEGFEQEFLKGAKETIVEQKPAMLISLYHKYSDFFDIQPMLESWNLGYQFKVIKPIDHNVSGETALYCEVR